MRDFLSLLDHSLPSFPEKCTARKKSWRDTTLPGGAIPFLLRKGISHPPGRYSPLNTSHKSSSISSWNFTIFFMPTLYLSLPLKNLSKSDLSVPLTGHLSIPLTGHPIFHAGLKAYLSLPLTYLSPARNTTSHTPLSQSGVIRSYVSSSFCVLFDLRRPFHRLIF